MTQDHWRALIESDVLRFVDIDRDYTLKIKKVEKGKVTGAGGKTSGKGMIWFEGADKPMVAGFTVLSTIADLYGKSPKKWVGQWITIFPDPTVKYGGAAVGGVRVRPAKPAENLCVPPPVKPAAAKEAQS
jgi:hypothetical protein